MCRRSWWRRPVTGQRSSVVRWPACTCGVTSTTRTRVRALRPSTGVSTVGFTLEYLDAGEWTGRATNAWTPLSWSQLVEYHGSRVHVNIVSADGDDFYHVQPEYTGYSLNAGAAELGVHVTFLQPGAHLVTATWVVETSSLDLCIIEHIKHAHGQYNSGLLYPFLSASWVIDVADDGAASTSDKVPAELVMRPSAESCDIAVAVLNTTRSGGHKVKLRGVTLSAWPVESL